MNSKKIVITGGPGTGKTSIINELKHLNFYCFDEIIRTLTLEAKQSHDPSDHKSNPIAFVKDPMDFNNRLLHGRLEQFKKASLIKEPLVFFDRGIPDVLAYMAFFNQVYNDDFLSICHNNKYNHVFLLPPWESIYISDNERLETFEESVEIHQLLKQTYQDLGYFITEVPFGTIEERTDFIIDNL
ncbi:ATPase [Yeosuana aromativorans]|uniref:ATPase n=1 Tax=Yeosuana aromativorans TaxID=288019 RepID=A0A8J3BU17_9FLAO|nr:ATP-binding protein [Yeosuana aromativorans]GGK35006.1 ATPase [Yeosuana aromativorans]